VARRVELLPAQAAALAAREPDVVALQELTVRSLGLWREALREAGLPYVLAGPPARPRRTQVLLAAREPLGPAEPLSLPWPETTVAGTAGGIAVHTAHVPNAANGWVKVRTLQAIRAGLAAGAGPRVLCGDLNTPRREHPDGTVVSFARDTKERLRAERGREWDEGELGVVPGLRDLGFADAFRALHGYVRKEPSWVFRHGGGWRLDHVFASAELRVLGARYHHDWRDAGLSDHSALEADLEPA
jgi:endonuclease/exonuclease/phosphatase family metal-dependent hydrolase